MRDVEHDFNLIKPIDKQFGSYLFPAGAPYQNECSANPVSVVLTGFFVVIISYWNSISGSCC